MEEGEIVAKEIGYTTSSSGGLSPWIGWGISTLLLFFLNRNSDSGSSTSNQQPSKFTEDNVNCIGQPVPVVLGRCMVKNPIISYYGDFNAEPYTEEYGMHSELDARSVLWPILLNIVYALVAPSQHKSTKTMKVDGPQVVGGQGGSLADPSVSGYVVDSENGRKFNILVNAIIYLLIAMLMNLFNNHLGRTTIQKGFLYYLGWQHIICWTGYNIGIRNVLLNVEDPETMVEMEVHGAQGIYDAIHPNEAIFITTALYKENGGNVRGAFTNFGRYSVYYDINSYANQSDINYINFTNDAYISTENDLMAFISSKNDINGCIIVLQGQGVSAFSLAFYKYLLSSNIPFVVWQYDRLPLNSANIYNMNDVTFSSYFDSSMDSSSDITIKNWMDSQQSNAYYLDVRSIILTAITQVSSGSLAHTYYNYLLNGKYYRLVNNSAVFSTTSLHCSLAFYYALAHIARLVHLPFDVPIKKKTEMSDLWEDANLSGAEILIDDKDLFGGYDEGGGFTGQIRFYFGNRQQPKDPWMVKSMNVSTIDADLRGLTPQYPMYLTCVVSNSDKTGGAYIGKQATIPEMWFEVLNYPSRIADNFKNEIVKVFSDKLDIAYQKPVNYIMNQDPSVQAYMKSYMENIEESLNSYQDAAIKFIRNYKSDDPDSAIYPSQTLLNKLSTDCELAINAYPPTNRADFSRSISELKNLAMKGTWHFSRLGEDLNPAEAIYEILMNKYWGCGYIKDRIDINSLVELGAVCEEEGLGVSCLINRVAQANDYITKILNHINGVKYDDPKTGKLTFKLIRNDYDVNKIKSFDVSNTESCEFSRLDWSETTSAVEVTFTDASNKYDTGQFTFTDISNRIITGFYTSKSVDGDYFTTTANAKWLAQTNQLSNGYPLSAVNLVTNRYAYDVTIGDPIKISWEPYGLTQVVYRVTDIDYATLTDGKISITGIEDVFGFDKLDFDVSESPQWTDPTEVPTEISRYMFMEDAYEMSHSLDTYVYAYAAKPSSDVVYWDVWRNVGGNYVKSSQSMMWSMMGRLTYGYLKDFDIDANGFEFSSLGSGGTDLIDDKIERINTYSTTYTNTSGLNILIVDNEIMSYGSIEKLPNGHYQVKNIIRGIFDTLPETHTAESIVYFVENRQNVAGAVKTVSTEGQSPVTEQLELRTETRNVAQPFDPTKIRSLTTTRRAEQPSVMANMKFGINMGTETVYEYDYTNDTIFSGDLLFTFLGRNKFDNYGIISQLDTTAIINVPTDVKNTIQTYSSNINGEWKTDAYDSTTYTNINNATLTWAQFCEQMGTSLKDANSVLLDVLTYNETKQLYSYDKYEKTINWKVPRFVGVVSDANEAQTLADSYINVTDNVILVPETTVSPAISLITTECPILIEGTLVTGTPSVNDIKCQDGNMYRLNNKAYRIVGWDSNNKAILYPFDIAEYYVIRSDFTELINNYPVYYKYNGVNYDEVTISTAI